jgi:hypothetical protein
MPKRKPISVQPKRKVGRPQGGAQKRDKRVTVLLTSAEHTKFVAEAETLGVPLFLYGRWLLTRHPIPGGGKS